MASPLAHAVRPPSTGEPPHPVLCLLHGRGADEQDMMPIAQEMPGELLVICLRGPLTFGPGFAWWDLASPEPAPELQRAMDQVWESLASLVPALQGNAQRLYMGGFSQGAILSAALALSRPRDLAGVILLSGYLPLSLPLPWTDPQDLPVFLGHGLHDEIIPVAHARAAWEYLTSVGADLFYREYPIGHAVSPDEVADLQRWLEGWLRPSHA